MEGESVVYDLKLSSIGPGKMTGFNAAVEPGNIDLAMKLHYIRGVYYFPKEAFDGVKTQEIKDPTFVWLNRYPVHNGRLRRDDAGRPFIKCNDCGVRFVEAKCRKTLEEWLQLKDAGDLEKLLVSGQVIGPELQFSPTVYVQLTRFEGGGVAVGVSWAHILGDAFAAIDFVNEWGRTVAGLADGPPIDLADYSPSRSKIAIEGGDPEDPISVIRVDPVGDHWIHSPGCKMELFTFEITPAQLSLVRTKVQVKGAFEAISAVLWQCIARIRGPEMEPKVVTVCRKGGGGDAEMLLKNTQIVGVVKADVSVLEALLSKLAALLTEAVDDRMEIESAMERSSGLADFVVYGANLSFVNLGEEEMYGFEYNKQKPIKVSLRIDGVGESGAILVLPDSGGGGRLVTAILPETEVAQLKINLKTEGFTV